MGLGGNEVGQLGDGTRVDKNAPVQVGSGTVWVAVVAGDSHTLALQADGTLWAWGRNYSGQLGDSTRVSKNTPVQVGSGTVWAAVAAGNFHTVALQADGTLWAWGSNWYGQLGDGTRASKAVPVQIGSATTWTLIAAGDYHTVGLQTDGTLWAWGGENGQLGDGEAWKETPQFITHQDAISSPGQPSINGGAGSSGGGSLGFLSVLFMLLFTIRHHRRR